MIDQTGSIHTSTEAVAREGFLPLVIATLIVLLAGALDADTLWIWLLSGILAATVYFYRNPERIPEEEGTHHYLAPIDGVVSKIETSEHSLNITIRNRWLDVHLLRAPCASVIDTETKQYGMALSIRSLLSQSLNRHQNWQLQTPCGGMLLRAQASFFPNLSRFYSSTSGFRQNQRIGFLSGGEVTLQLPLRTRLTIHEQDSIDGGRTILGYPTDT